MFRVAAAVSVLCAVAHGRPLNIDVRDDKIINDVTFSKTKDSTEGSIDVSDVKLVDVATVSNQLRSQETKNADGAFLKEKTGDKVKGVRYSGDYNKEDSAVLFDENIVLESTIMAAKSGEALADKENAEFEGGESVVASKNVVVRDGGGVVPVVEITKVDQYLSESAHNIDPDNLDSKTSVSGGQLKSIDIGEGALVLTKQKSGELARNVAVTNDNGGSESIQKTGSAFKEESVVLDSGPFDIQATNTFEIANADVSVEDLPALRNWVLNTDAAHLKLVILKMLDYTS